MYISIANKSRYVVDTIGIYLSDSAISGLHSHSPLSYNPQLKINIFTITDTLNWTLISGNFIADGGENFLIIGNFDDDAGTGSLLINSNVGGLYYAYILIDNVSLTPSTGLENYETDARVRIYPNPVTDYLHIELDNINYCQITLYDLAGRIVINETLNNSRILNVSCLTKGSYFFEIKNNNSIIQQGRIFRN
jgi:hypothetical protein